MRDDKRFGVAHLKVGAVQTDRQTHRQIRLNVLPRSTRGW